MRLYANVWHIEWTTVRIGPYTQHRHARTRHTATHISCRIFCFLFFSTHFVAFYYSYHLMWVVSCACVCDLWHCVAPVYVCEGSVSVRNNRSVRQRHYRINVVVCAIDRESTSHCVYVLVCAVCIRISIRLHIVTERVWYKEIFPIGSVRQCLWKWQYNSIPKQEWNSQFAAKKRNRHTESAFFS